MYDGILLPTDGEAGAEEATRHAVELAAACDAVLHVLYVVDESVYTTYPGDEYVHEREGLEAALEQTGERTLEAVKETATDAGIAARTALRYGTPHREIVNYADEEAVDLIVIGTKHRSGTYRRLLGSVTERVVRLTDRPVTVVKTRAE